jgi:CubicO group peptidase (beta-lactamase class C family)
MARWDLALYDNPLIPVELQERAWTPGLEDYGFGWRINDYSGYRRIHHTGGTCGFSTIYIRFPDEDLSFIVFSNRREPGISSVAYELVDHFLN